MIKTKLTIKEISRSDISTAEYNPRTMTKGSRDRLKKGLERFGLAVPLIWNEKTGTLVGGHQRLSILDEDNGYPATDYKVAVSVVNLNKKDEATLNVQLNNTSMQGEFDIERLNGLLDFGVEIDELGFDESEVEMLFKDFQILEDSTDVQESKSELDKIKEERAEMNAEKAEENSANFYFVVVCENAKEKETILRLLGVEPHEEFITAKQLRTISSVEF